MSFAPAVFSGLQLFSGIMQSQAQKQEAQIRATELEYSAGSAIFNANIAKQESKLAQEKARIEVARQKRAGEKLVSSQRALYAASGVRVDVGTPLLVMAETMEEIELDIAITKFNADVEESRKISEARQEELRAGQLRTAAGQEIVAGRIRAGTTLLESVSTFGKKFIGD